LTFREFHGSRLNSKYFPLMSSISLTPLPSSRIGEESDALKMERDGFVDEAVVLALVNSPRHFRSNAYPADLALAADDLDFAGWQIPSSTPVRAPEIPPQVISAIVRRASPPTLGVSEISAHHDSSRRWWMVGLIGVLSTLLFTVLLATLLTRIESEPQAPIKVEASSFAGTSPVQLTGSWSRAMPSSTEASLQPR
jgi:hypothetical protein